MPYTPRSRPPSTEPTFPLATPTPASSFVPTGDVPIASTSRLAAGAFASPADPAPAPAFQPERPMAVVRTASSDLVGGFGAASCRYQPYLASLNTDSRTWANVGAAKPAPATGSGFPLESPISAGDTASSSSVLTPTSFGAGAAQSAVYDPSSVSPATYYGAGSLAYAQQTPLASEFSAQPRAMPPYVSSSAGAFTQSGPVSPADATGLYNPASYQARRHTVVGYGSALAPVDTEDIVVKEEKRRRNKESSQRFRDRTRERQREKQERLEYLERRVQDLEGQVRGNPAGASTSASTDTETTIQQLQRENAALRAALNKAELEVQNLLGNTGSAPFNQQGFYATLPKLSPPDSTYQALSERGSHSPPSIGGQGTSRGTGQTTPETSFSTRAHVHYPFSDTRAEGHPPAQAPGVPATDLGRPGSSHYQLLPTSSKPGHSEQEARAAADPTGSFFGWGAEGPTEG